MSNENSEGAKALHGLKKNEGKKHSESGDEKAKEESRDVEAAVLKYVAGTLDPDTSKRRRSANNEDANEIPHWNSFLDN